MKYINNTDVPFVVRRIYTLYIGVLFILISSCTQNTDGYKPVDYKSDYIAVIEDSNIVANPEMELVIKPYRDSMMQDMNKVVGYADAEMRKSKPSGTLNNIVTDMVLEAISKDNNWQIDFCLLNYGGLRRQLPKGKLMKSDIFQLMPFQNEAVIVKVNSSGMKNLFKYLYFSGGQPVSGLQVNFTDSVKFIATIQEDVWDTTKSYWVLTSDYTANGGDKMNFFAQKDSVIMTGVLLRDAIFEYLDSLQNENTSLKVDSVLRITFE